MDVRGIVLLGCLTGAIAGTHLDVLLFKIFDCFLIIGLVQIFSLTAKLLSFFVQPKIVLYLNIHFYLIPFIKFNAV